MASVPPGAPGTPVITGAVSEGFVKGDAFHEVAFGSWISCPSPSAAAPRSGCRSAMVSASRMRICALLYSRSLPSVLVADSPTSGLRIIEIGSVQGGGLLVQLFCTKGNCIFVAPVSELVTNPFRVPEEILGKLELTAPATVGYPPLQLASVGSTPAAGRATQFEPVGGNVFSWQPALALGTYTVPP